MGIMDNLKSIANYFTGGGAEISMEVPRAARAGEPLPVVVHATIGDVSVRASRIFVAVRAVETIDAHYTHGILENRPGSKSPVHVTTTMYSHDFPVLGAIELPAGSTHTWYVDVVLPPDAVPTYLGKHARHEWMVSAVIDVAGTDPQSQWTPIFVRPAC
ncbi:MAG: hypothetical protein FJX76_16380 [Armatimonadetes bacterium]|nr:hypothetical protein [Armatimonadota bacterium]